jgi:hypothetical protein
MLLRVVIGVGVATFVLNTAYSRIRGDSEFDSYYNGKQYKFVITEAQQARCPKWDPRTAPNPPCSAAKALEQARRFIGTIATKNNTFWEFEHLALVDVSGGWAWRATYDLTLRGASTGVWPRMDCWILMDGTVIKPYSGRTRET